MKKLALPDTELNDYAVVDEICLVDPWKPHKGNWNAAYAQYYAAKGNPWKFGPAEFPGEIGELQYNLYDSRRTGGPIERIRDTKGLLSCPMCGSSVTGHLDHYLPRSVFKEFSIMRANLVPACNHCNSGVKGANYKGVGAERFIHPYFDDWANDPLWKITLTPPYAAPEFVPSSLDALQADRKSIVDYHLRYVLEKQFYRSMANLWSTMPDVILDRLDGDELTIESVRVALAKELKRAVKTTGTNSWHSALFRGLEADLPGIEYLMLQVEALIDAA